MLATTCPSREALLRYSVGLASVEQSDELEDHLGSCPDCQATILTLADADDTLVRRLRTPPDSESYLAEPQFHAAIADAIARSDWGAVEQEASDAEGGRAAMPKTLGEYQLLEELGRGGMGRVYKALQTKLDRVVALKVLPRNRVGNRQAINRFEREMKAVGRLAHPNIVQAYDAREIDDTPVLIMEFVDGLDLAEIVRRCTHHAPRDGLHHAERDEYGVPVAEACELVRRTSLALQCAHEHGLVHRDIKPSNIMLARSGEVKLLDLGLARFYAEGGGSVPPASAGEEMTDTGQAMGTADYMAPEQATDSRSVDIRADIYGLGCTLYKLLSGRAPFSGPEYRSTLDKLNAHVHQPVPSIRGFAPNVPEELAAILDRMLAKDPRDRFATPADVGVALEPFCRGANLNDLIVRAMAIGESPRSLGEGASEGPHGDPEGASASQLALRESVSASPLSLRERVRVRAAAPILRRPIVRRILIGLGFFGAMSAAFAAGIVITIKRSGSTNQLGVPDNARTDIDDNGNATVNILADQGATKASAPDNQGQATTGPPSLPEEAKHSIVRVYRVTGISPESALQILQPVFAGAPDVRLTVDAKTASLVALARPAQHDVIRTVLKEICAPRTLRFHFHMQPWKDVLEWVAHEAGLSLDADIGWPEGTLNYSDDREFTPDEAIDLLNSLLLSKNYTLTRPPGALVLVRLDHGGPRRIPTIPEDTLDKRGDHEFVSVVFHVPYASFEKLKPRLTPLLSSHGAWSSKSMPPTGIGLVVIDLASHVRKFRDAIKEIQATAAGPDASKLTPTTPPEVTVIHPIVRQVTLHEDFTGYIVAAQTAEIRARVTGNLEKVHVKPGMSVKQGDILVEIDSGQYRAELDQALVAVTQAKVHLDLRNGEFKRAEELLRNNAVGKSEFDQAKAQQADAAAGLQTAQAAVNVARLRLEHTKIVAPFAGTISGPVLDAGNLATADNTVLATISSTDPMRVEFDVQETVLAGLPHKGGHAHEAALSLPVLCALSGDKDFLYHAKMDCVDSTVGPGGTVRCCALLPNGEGKFMRGMNIRVRLITDSSYNALLIPDTAVGTDHDQKFVFIVNDRNVAERRVVKTAELDGDLRVVTEGLNAEDWVITSGIGPALRPGTIVKPEKPSPPARPRN